MRVIGLLSWYDENPAWLAECVASASRLCDHLVAVDGAYAQFPGSLTQPYSGAEQAEVIALTAAGCGMGVTVHVPREVWWGGEVAKRNFMFKLGSTLTTEADWFFRIDADEVLDRVPANTRDLLEQTGCDVAEVNIYDEGRSPFRCLFRALPGIGIEQAHYVVTATVDGRRVILRGDPAVHRQEPAEPLWSVKLVHRSSARPAARLQRKAVYNAQVAAMGLEHSGPFEGGAA